MEGQETAARHHAHTSRTGRWSRAALAALTARTGGADLPHLRVFVRFSLISLAGTAVDFLALWGLVTLAGLDVVPAKILASEASILNSFVWNERWTFAERAAGHGLARRLIAFNGASLGSLLVSLAIVALGVAIAGRQAYLLANAVALPASFVCTYAASNWVIWRRRPRS
jgi:putative flippase GtrA